MKEENFGKGFYLDVFIAIRVLLMKERTAQFKGAFKLIRGYPICIDLDFKNCQLRRYIPKHPKDKTPLIPICKYFEEDTNLSFSAGKKFFNKELFNKVCPKFLNEILPLAAEVESNERRIKKIFNKAKIGDKLYCTEEMEDVTLLSIPKKFEKVKYRSSLGRIREADQFTFYDINYVDYYILKGPDIDKRRLKIEMIAQVSGLICEPVTKDGSEALYLAGNSKETVQNFIDFCCKKDLMLL